MRRQKSLDELWRVQQSETPEKKARLDDEREPFSSIKKKCSDAQWHVFQEEIAAKRAEEEKLKAEKRRNKSLRDDAKLGEVRDPSTNGRGVSLTMHMGRKAHSYYKEHGITKHKRELGGPIYRRDRTAHEKLAVLIAVDCKCRAILKDKTSERGNWNTLPLIERKALEQRFQITWEQMHSWDKRRSALQLFVSKHRLGKHGLRPCGSRGKTLTGTSSQGKRLADEDKSEHKPLFPVLKRLQTWLKNERSFNHEVRKSHVVERFMYELEYERDKQDVLEQHKSLDFKPKTLERIRVILRDYRVIHPSRRQDRWFGKCILPNIGGRIRAAQRLHDKPIVLDAVKAKLSWQTSDWFQHLVCQGTAEQLAEFVSKPTEFVMHRKKTAYVVMDQTAVWLKVRGEESLVYHASELAATATRKRQSKVYKAASTDADRQQAAAAMAEEAANNPAFKAQCTSSYTSGGDKYRLTLINISAVEQWFDSSSTPLPVKKRLVLLVPCSEHCKLQDIDKEGKWIRDWSTKTTSGEILLYKKGESARNKLLTWRATRDALLEENEDHEFMFEVWGQPKAWTDEIIAAWVVEFIAEQYGQCLVLSDCLAAQWTEPVLLQAWLSQVIWAPLAPDVTSYLAEPDTHEHAQMKAEIKKAKAELHHQHEHAWKSQRAEGSTDTYMPKWGPFEVWAVLERALKAFKRNNRVVPLEGLIKNQFLVFRPNNEGVLEKINEGKAWAVPLLPPTRGIENKLACERLAARAEWVDGVPPRPDWEELDNINFEWNQAPNEMPPAEAEYALDCEFSSLNLTERQRSMLQPVSSRIRNIEYPEAVRKRTAVKKLAKRKNKWARKFHKLFQGKGRDKWHAALKQHGPEACQDKLDLLPTKKAVAKAKATEAEIQAAVDKRMSKLKTGKSTETFIKKARWRRKDRNLRVKKEGSEIADSEWLGKFVRVVADIPHEGRAGAVAKVYASGVQDEVRLHLFDESDKGGVFSCSSKDVLIEDPSAQPKQFTRFSIDWRYYKPIHREVIRKRLEGADKTAIEQLVYGTMIEQSSISALCMEIEARFQLDESGVLIIPPSVTTALACMEQGEDDIGGEAAKFRSKVAEADHVFFAVWADKPRHTLHVIN